MVSVRLNGPNSFGATMSQTSAGRMLLRCIAPVLVVATSAGCQPPSATQADGGTPGQDAGQAEDAGWVERGDGGAYRITRPLEVNGVRVEAVIARPANDAVDALLLFHGTVGSNALVLQAANDTLDAFRAILDRDDLLLVSVAYPEEGLLMGDNVAHAEAALLWVQRHAAAALGVTVNRVFLAGHSQGGYVVTRLNTLYAVDGVVANAPGPLDLVFRCGLEEDGRLETSRVCRDLTAAAGSTTSNPQAYAARSLLSFTSGQRSNILFVQGLDDSPIQMRSWPMFRQQLEACTNCQERSFIELPGMQHPALFRSPEAQRALNEMVRRR